MHKTHEVTISWSMSYVMAANEGERGACGCGNVLVGGGAEQDEVHLGLEKLGVRLLLNRGPALLLCAT